MIEDLATSDKSEDQEKFKIFWREFGQVLKEGVAEDYSNRERIAKLLRFTSTHDEREEQTVSLDDYIARMKPEQEKIYYITADGLKAAQSSPHLEIFRKGIEVLLLHDRIDEWLTANLNEYAGKSCNLSPRAILIWANWKTKTKRKTTKRKQEIFRNLQQR